MKELTLQQFLDRLASADPAPGGGTAAALAGAAAAALIAMVARISQGKNPDPAFAAMIEQGERSRELLTALMAEDAQAFTAVIQASRMARATDEEKQARRAALQQALRGAAAVPLRVAQEAVVVLQVAGELARTGNPNALSDVATAALLGYAAVGSALANVRINLKAMTDQAYVAESAAEVQRLDHAAAILRDTAMARVQERL